MTEQELTELEALEQATTPGEWKTAGHDLCDDNGHIGSFEDIVNAAFVTVLHNAFPRLAAALRAAWAEKDAK